MNKTLAALAALLLAACEPLPAVDQAAELEALMQFSSDWSDMVMTAPPGEVLEFWADDAVMAPPNLDFIEGKEAIAGYLANYMGDSAVVPNFSIEWTPRSGYVSESGDLAYLIETNLVRFDDPEGNPVAIRGKVVTVWKKNEAGEWRNVVDMWNSFEPAE